MNPADKQLAVVGCVIEGLRRYFHDQTPLGGKLGHPQHRGGVNIPIDGLTGEDCTGLVWANVLRRWSTVEFPAEVDVPRPCGAPRAIRIQVGAARCAVGLDDHGFAPTPDALEREALIVLDDGNRLENAVCFASALAEDRDLTSDVVVGAWEPVGPEGGIIAGILTVTFQLT